MLSSAGVYLGGGARKGAIGEGKHAQCAETWFVCPPSFFGGTHPGGPTLLIPRISGSGGHVTRRGGHVTRPGPSELASLLGPLTGSQLGSGVTQGPDRNLLGFWRERLLLSLK